MNIKQISDLTRIAYNACAQKYHDLFKDELEIKSCDRRILDEFADYFKEKQIVYDMGCGPSGQIGYYVHSKGIKVIGVDICDKCVEVARNYHPSMKFERRDITNLSLKDRSIDGIISYYSIIHTPKKYVDKIFREFRSVLKKRGKLLITVKEGTLEGMVNNFLECGTQIYFTHFTKNEIRNYFERNGFKILLLEKRVPYEEEIALNRIYALGEKI